MEREKHLRLEKNYLLASAAAVFTAFLCINIYPEYHGGPQIGSSGLFALSAAMVAMMIYIVKKVLTDRSEETSETDGKPVSDPARLKRMFFLWSICTVLLAASLVRYPLYLHYKMNENMGYRGMISLIIGSVLIVVTLYHVISRLKDYR